MKVPFTWKVTGWFMVGWSAEFAAGETRPLRYFGEDLVAYRDEVGELHVLSGHCRHLGAHIGHGGKVNAQYNVAAPDTLPTKLAAMQRRKMFDAFLDFGPAPDDAILDIGATSDRSTGIFLLSLVGGTRLRCDLSSGIRIRRGRT